MGIFIKNAMHWRQKNRISQTVKGPKFECFNYVSSLPLNVRGRSENYKLQLGPLTSHLRDDKHSIFVF